MEGAHAVSCKRNLPTAVSPLYLCSHALPLTSTSSCASILHPTAFTPSQRRSLTRQPQNRLFSLPPTFNRKFVKSSLPSLSHPSIPYHHHIFCSTPHALLSSALTGPNRNRIKFSPSHLRPFIPPIIYHPPRHASNPFPSTAKIFIPIPIRLIKPHHLPSPHIHVGNSPQLSSQNVLCVKIFILISPDSCSPHKIPPTTHHPVSQPKRFTASRVIAQKVFPPYN